MSNFIKHKRKQISELRPVDLGDIINFNEDGVIIISYNKDNPLTVSISDVDKQNGSPKLGDWIARNPENYLDQWLVAEKYYKDNFEKL